MAIRKRTQLLFFGNDEAEARLIAHVLDADVVITTNADAALRCILVRQLDVILCAADDTRVAAIEDLLGAVKSVCPSKLRNILVVAEAVPAPLERVIRAREIRVLARPFRIADLRASVAPEAA
jgi:hypothetical protein